MFSTSTRKWFLALYLVGAVNAVPGSFASFVATTGNETATFATGTMVLENKLNGEPLCASNDDDDPETGNGQEPTDVNARDCAALFTLTNRDPGGSSFREVRLENAGTVDGSLTVAWTGPGACTTTVPDPLGHHGSGDLCGDLRWYVQEFPDQAAMDDNDRTLGTCWYGNVTVPTDCGFQNNRDLAHFSATHPLASPLALGPLPAGDQRFFRVYLSLRGAAGNELQGLSTEFGITWTLDQ